MNQVFDPQNFGFKCPRCGATVRGGRFWVFNEAGGLDMSGHFKTYETTAVGFYHCDEEWDIPVRLCVKLPADRPA